MSDVMNERQKQLAAGIRHRAAGLRQTLARESNAIQVDAREMMLNGQHRRAVTLLALGDRLEAAADSERGLHRALLHAVEAYPPREALGYIDYARGLVEAQQGIVSEARRETGRTTQHDIEEVRQQLLELRYLWRLVEVEQ